MKQSIYHFILITLISSNFILTNQDNPKVALVLSGGAARGYAHIPVIEMIDSLDIQIDIIVGTSIGSIVGALYASGYTGKDIYDFAFDTDWVSIFLDKSDRKNMSYFHKRDASRYQIDFNLKGLTPELPSGVIYGQRAYIELSNILGQYEYIKNFEDLYIPFYCNSTDLITGKDIVFSNGSLITSIRSSISIPTIFSPVDYQNYLLVDGGVKNNVPVNIAKDLGADIIFTSMVASSKPSKEEIKSSVIDVVGESIFIHTSDLTKSNLKQSDYVLSVNMPQGTAAGFTENRIKRIYDYGKKEVYKNLDLFIDLKQKVGSKKIKSKPPKLDDLKLIVKDVTINGNKKLNDDFILNSFGLYPKDTLKLEYIHNGINNLYGLGYFNDIQYELTPNVDLSEVIIGLNINEASFNKFQTGLKWDNYHELIAVANIKTNDLIFPGLLIQNEFQFPGIRKNKFEISYPRKIFNIPFYPFYRNQYLRKDIDWYDNNGIKAAIYNIRSISNSTGLGFVFGKNFGIEFGIESESSDLTLEIPNNNLETYKNEIITSAYLSLNIDSRDNALLTKNGALIDIHLLNSNYNDIDFKSLTLNYDFYTTIRRNTFRFNGIYRSIDNHSPIHNTLFQGPVEQTIGYQPYSLNSNELIIAGLEWMYHYKEMHFRLFANNLLSFKRSIDNYENDGTIPSFGLGVTFTSPFGPIDFIYSEGPKVFSNSNETQSIIYFNVGYKF